MFNFLNRKKKIPASDAERCAFVKSLIKKRYDLSPEVQLAYMMIGMQVEDLEEGLVMVSFPEAVILKISEQYIIQVERGLSDEMLIPYLNTFHAGLLSAAGENLPDMDPPYSLERYLEHYLAHIHGNGPAPVNPSFLPIAIHEVRTFYGRAES